MQLGWSFFCFLLFCFLVFLFFRLIEFWLSIGTMFGLSIGTMIWVEVKMSDGDSGIYKRSEDGLRIEKVEWRQCDPCNE